MKELLCRKVLAERDLSLDDPKIRPAGRDPSLEYRRLAYESRRMGREIGPLSRLPALKRTQPNPFRLGTTDESESQM